MPGFVVPMNPICDVIFISKMKKLPVDWKQPQGEEGKQYPDAFKPEERSAVPEPLCYFFCASTNKYHVENAKKIGKLFKDFAHEALDKTKNAIDLWRAEAKLKDLKVMSVTAIGAPGCLDGPKLKDKYVGWEPTEKNMKAYAKAVKEGVSKCWEEWQGQVMVPGLPWYPAFAAFPSASAAPVPNIPMPLITCPSPMMSKMTPTQLKQAMCDALDSGVKDKDSDKQYEALFEAIGTAISVAFLAWLPMQLVMNVMGKGPIPTFAPPYVPVGPVVGGDNIAAPGHLSA